VTDRRRRTLPPAILIFEILSIFSRLFAFFCGRGGERSRRRPSGRERGRALESMRLQQNLPGGKNDVGGDGGEIVEELAAGDEFLPCSAPGGFGAVAHGVDREGQQV
jgi:hypothetical protein